MKPKPLGCFAPLGLASSLVMLVIIGLLVLLTGGGIFSPGALNRQAGPALGGVSSHSALSENCGACHPAPWSGVLMSTRCLACHQNVQAELARPDSLHGVVGGGKSPLRCQACHTEHKGPEASLTVYSTANLPHEKLGFALTAHRKTAQGSPFACRDCHAGYAEQYDQTQCSTCHQKLDAAFVARHTAAYGATCLGCHDGLDSYGKNFSHNQASFKLTGKHQPLDCGGCHTGARTIADFKGTQTACFACHQKDDRHQGSFGQDCSSCHVPDGWSQVNFDHSKASFQLTGAHASVDCKKCHTTDDYKSTPTTCFACHQQDDPHHGSLGQDCAACHVTEAWTKVTFDHSQAPFQLTGAHLGVDCRSCHADNDFKSTPTTCFACHQKDDHHSGAFGQDCAACHVTDAWSKVNFDHSKAAFPLTGAHVTVDCVKCHANGVFKGTPTACFACHQKDDHHNGAFGQDCAACHVTDAWNKVTFDHSKSGFPLTGAHQSLACTRCHINGVFKGTSTQCVGCHQEPAFHRGLLGTDCKACHTTSAWRPAAFNRAHAFPLNHGGANSCRSCHPSSLGAYDCFSCHQQAQMIDKHQGVANLSDCVRCHPNGRGGGD